MPDYVQYRKIPLRVEMGQQPVLSLAIKKPLLPFFCMQTLKYINYNRKSTDSEDRQILSILAQEESALEMAQRDGFVISETINESKSAKIPMKREGFTRMITAIKRGQYNAIVCWKLDRLARNMEEGGQIIELLQQGKLLEIRTPGKTYTPDENIIVLAVEFGSAGQFSRDLSENVKRGLRKKAQMGIPHGVAPFGYINIRDRRGNRLWKPDRERLDIVGAVFVKALDRTMTTRELYRWTVKKFRPMTLKRNKLGGKLLAESYFYYMLRNPIYAGFFEHDNIRYELAPSIPRAVSESQFWRLQAFLNNTIASKRYRHNATYTGIIKSPFGEFIGADVKHQLTCDCKHKFSSVNRDRCPKCGTPIHEMKSPKSATYTYYYNVAKKKRGEHVKMLPETAVEHKVWNVLSLLEFSPELKEWIRRNATRNSATDEERLADERRRKTIAELTAKRKRLRSLLVDGIITQEEYLSDTNEIDAILAQVTSATEEKGNEFRQSLDTVLDAHEAISVDVPDAKKELLVKIGSNLTWDEENLCIHWPKWLLELISGLIEAMAINPRFEPKKTLADKDETEVFASVSPTLCKSLKDVRNIFHQDSQ